MMSDKEIIARRVFGMFDTFGINDKVGRIDVAKRILQKIKEEQ